MNSLGAEYVKGSSILYEYHLHRLYPLNLDGPTADSWIISVANELAQKSVVQQRHFGEVMICMRSSVIPVLYVTI